MTHDTTTQDVPPVAVAAPEAAAITPADLFKSHRIDKKTAEEGIWIKIRGDRFLVAAANAERVTADRASFLMEHGLSPDVDVPPELLDEWNSRAFARHVLRDARFKNAPHMKYSEAIGRTIHSDPELKNLKQEILQVSVGDWTKEHIALQVQLGNWEPYSNGSASAETLKTR